MRVETIGSATLYLGDCREILPNLPKVDAVITDPPYGLNFSSGMGGKFKGISIKNDDSVDCRDWVIDHFIGVKGLYFGSWKIEKPKDTKQTLIWDKGEHVGMGDLSLPWRPNTEEIYVVGKGFEGHRGSSVIRFNAPSPNFTPDQKRYHPTEKPVGLISLLLAKTPAHTVCDPFMGGGSTGVACVEAGRNFIGIEIDPGYFDTCCRRIEDAQRQGRMFV